MVVSACYLYLMCCCAGSHNERMQVACNTQQDLQDWLDLLTKHTHTPAPHTPSYKHQSVCHTVRVQDFLTNTIIISCLGKILVKFLFSVSASCPLILALPPGCLSHTEGAQDKCTTLFPIHSLLGHYTATVQRGGPWSHQVPGNPGAWAALDPHLHSGPQLQIVKKRFLSLLVKLQSLPSPHDFSHSWIWTKICTFQCLIKLSKQLFFCLFWRIWIRVQRIWRSYYLKGSQRGNLQKRTSLWEKVWNSLTF